MAASSSDDVNRYAGIEQERFMGAAEIVEPEPWETEFSRLPDKFLSQTAGGRAAG